LKDSKAIKPMTIVKHLAMSPITLFDGYLFKLFDGKNSSLLMKK